jgi:hypothetical protein
VKGSNTTAAISEAPENGTTGTKVEKYFSGTRKPHIILLEL